MKIAVVSGKGGSGKSSISASFIALSRKVVAVDCDVDASNLPLLFSYRPMAEERFVSGENVVVDEDLCDRCGICERNCAYGAIRFDGERMATVPFLCEACGLCARLCPRKAIRLEEDAGSRIYTDSIANGYLVCGSLRPGDDNSGKMIARVREVADRVMKDENVPLQILDGPPGIGCPVLSTLTGVDRVVIVCEPTLSGLSDLQRIYTVALSYCQDIMVVVNKSDINPKILQGIRSFCQTLHLPVVAEIPFDPELVSAQVKGTTIVQHAPDSIAAKEIRKAYHKIKTGGEN